MKTNFKITIGVIVVLALLMIKPVSTMIKNSQTTPEEAAIEAQILKDREAREKMSASSDEAYVMAREIFKKQILKVPDGAEFQPAYEVTPIDKGDDSYDMTFWVMAQNSFGVKIKTTYNIVVKETYDNKWKITYMQKIE